jgi:phage shock protein PspC (stress-responsive transcriptional regulator)
MVSQAVTPARLDRARLPRRTEHRLVAGVAGGIADRLNAPVAFVRFFILVATIWSPFVFAAYGAAALVLPAGGRNQPDWDNLVGAGRLALVLAAPWLALWSPLAINEPIDGSAGWVVAAVGLLAVGAVAMFSADYRREGGRTREEARSAVLGALPAAACGLLLAAAIVLVPDVRWERFVPLVAIAGGAALLVAGRREHVAPALLVLAVAVVVVASGARLDGGVGDVRMKPADPRGEPIVVRRAFGDVELDLRRVRNAVAPVDVEVSAGMGDVEVTVPEWARVEVDARVGRGEIDVERMAGSRDYGFDQHAGRGLPGRPGGARIEIVADVGSGTIHIERFGA